MPSDRSLCSNCTLNVWLLHLGVSMFTLASFPGLAHLPLAVQNEHRKSGQFHVMHATFFYVTPSI